MASIVEQAGTRRLQLGNEEFARTMAIGNRWSKLRIGITLGFNGQTTFAATMLMGLCSGTTNTYNAASTDGFIGVCPVQFTPDITWTYSASPSTYSNPNPGKRFITKIGAATTNNAGFGSAAWGMADAVTSLCMWILTFYRGPNEYNSNQTWDQIFCFSSHPLNNTYASLPMELEDYAFYKNLENDTDSGRYGLSNYDAQSTLVTWTGPALDTFSFVWNQASPTVEIGHIGIIRVV